METILLSTGTGFGPDSISRWGALRGDAQTRNEERTEGKKRNLSRRGPRSTVEPHTVAVGVDVVVGARGSGVRCSGAMVQWWVLVVVTVHSSRLQGDGEEKRKEKKVWSPKPFNQEPRPTAPPVGATGHVGICIWLDRPISGVRKHKSWKVRSGSAAQSISHCVGNGSHSPLHFLCTAMQCSCSRELTSLSQARSSSKDIEIVTANDGSEFKALAFVPHKKRT